MDLFSETPVSLLDAARDRYIHYALSVIHARALPDVRDGLKPVQRRILYAMYHNLGLIHTGRYRKSAAVVGEVMAKYHPHGDSAIYEAMVRMAQDFSLLHPLVDGQGNFGSLDGDNAAAMRYTEARLRPLAEDLLSEIKSKTVDYRPTYDGQGFEPIVLPAQVPNLLINGAEGIAVGMATRIPPHNLREVLDACLLLLDRPHVDVEELCRKVQGPDFPTGGEIISSPGELRQVYEEGQGPVKIRATWTTEQRGKKHCILITSVPYGLVKGPLVEKLGELVAQRRIPQLVDVKDESTTDVRIVLELRGPGDAEAAMAWLYRHTPLQGFFHVNLTCLVPTENPEIGAPERLNLKQLLEHWLAFRLLTLRRRLSHELAQLRERIHVLTAYERIFDALDEVIRIIRASEGKRDAAEKLMDRFDLDDVQVEAILELKLYRLARLELLVIRQELAEKRAAAERLDSILASESEMKALMRSELVTLRKQHGKARQTLLRGESAEVAYDENAYIVAEDTIVVATRDGWIKRQASVSSVEKVRVREGDAVLWAARCSTASNVAFFTTAGGGYVLRADTVPATTGHGEPVQRHFAFADRESVVGMVSHDPRNLPEVESAGEEDAGPWLVAATRQGRIVRVPLSVHREVSNRNGRRFLKVEEGDLVLAAFSSDGTEHVCLATRDGHGLCFPVADVPVVKGVGKGVTAIELKEGDEVLAFELTREGATGPIVLSGVGIAEVICPDRHSAGRGAKGKKIVKKGVFSLWKRNPELLLDQGAESEARPREES